jgi:hypothetical protein
MASADTFVRQTKHSGKEPGDKHSDGGGLYMSGAAESTGGSTTALKVSKRRFPGVYPAVTLAAARRLRDQAGQQLAAGNDPSAVRRRIRKNASALSRRRSKQSAYRGCSTPRAQDAIPGSELAGPRSISGHRPNAYYSVAAA